MTDPIMQLDAELEWLGEIADELERQVAPCPVTRVLLVAWLTEWVPTPQGRTAMRRELPHLPQALKSAYAVWIHDGGAR